MKKWILVLGLAPSLLFASVPDCLRDRGVDEHDNRVIDGGFAISLDHTKYSKGELLDFLGSFQGNPNVYAKGFPLIWKNWVSFDAGPQAVASDESFDSIQERVYGEIEKIQARPGVTVKCEVHPHPHPSASGGT